MGNMIVGFTPFKDYGRLSFMYTAGIITVSDKGAAGEREDLSGPILKEILENAGFSVQFTCIVPDETDQLEAGIITACDIYALDIVLTTGGTGLSLRDRTPEATKRVIERDAPGFSEAIRESGLKSTPHAMISRGVSGVRGKTLIINLPGSPKGAREGLNVVLPALPHALSKLKGDTYECGG